jgi:hypothetical protein
MKFYLLFTSCIHVDTLSQEGVESFLAGEPQFHCREVNTDTDLPVALKKVERYGSFMFMDKKRFKELEPYSEE